MTKLYTEVHVGDFFHIFMESFVEGYSNSRKMWYYGNAKLPRIVILHRPRFHSRGQPFSRKIPSNLSSGLRWRKNMLNYT